MLDPVFFFFDHLIQTKMLPRKMASKTFFAKFTEYCEKEGYPTPKDMETVTKIIESVESVPGVDIFDWVDIFIEEIEFPDPEMLKKCLDKLVIESKCLLTEEPQLGVDLIGPKGTRSLEGIYEEIENSPTREASPTVTRRPRARGTGGLQFSNKTWKATLSGKHIGSYATKEGAINAIEKAKCLLQAPDPPTAKSPEDIFEREKRQARRREEYKKNSERERESSRRYYWKKKGLSPPIESESVVKEYDALRAEIIKRQGELDKMRSNFKSLGAKKRKLEIEEEEKM